MEDKRVNSFTWLGLFISLAGIFIVTTIFKLLVEHRTALSVLLREGILFALLIVLLWIIKNREHLNFRAIYFNESKIGQSVLWGLGGAIVCGAVAVGTLLLLQSLGLQMKSEGQAPLPLWVTFIVILRAAIVEEVFFRGYAITRLEAVTGNKYLSAVAPLLVFSLLHYGQGLAGIIVTFMMGAVLTLLFLQRKDLLTVIVAHFVIDFIPNILGPLMSAGE